MKTKTLVATALGAALFTVLFSYVKVPSPVPNTNFQIAYGVAAFFAVVFGPIAGGLIAFIGHALSDTIIWGGAWWSWVIASGVSMFVVGLSAKRIKVEGTLSITDVIVFNVYQVVAHLLAWLIIAPALDILIYKEPVELLKFQGATAAGMNIISTGVVGTLLLLAYAKTRVKEGTLS